LKRFGELDTSLLAEIQNKFEEITVVDKKGYILGSNYKKLWDIFPFPEVISSFEEVLKEGKSSCKVKEEEKTYLLKFKKVRDFILILKSDVSLNEEYENIKKSVVSTLSHEIKTPLSSALGNVEYLLLYGNCEEREILEEVLEKLRELNSIVGGIENLFKYSHLNFSWINLRPITEEVINELRKEAENKGVKLIYKLVDVSLPADKVLYSQMVRNLLSNAINFTDRGRVEVELTENYLRILDTGRGISKELLPKIFDRFVKGEESSGQGVGLSIVREIVKFHNWKIDVESKEGEGTTFTVHFKGGGRDV
jgi:two-component system phosphate regulon sensor histidine kinase PhoR